jgi:thiamine pyrophosphate-dependent acetolactate synthase large subunit-like protein
MHEIQRALPIDACVVADIGTSCLFVAHYLRVSPPQRCYIPMVWSCMGHPLGAALGVRLGSGAPTICVTGDAAFLSKGLELHAAVEQGVSGLVCVVLSNRGHGLVRLGTAAIVGQGHAVEDGTFAFTPDIAAIARAVGARAHCVREADQLAPALADALRGAGPCVVEVHVDPNAAPPMADRIQGLGASAVPSACSQ